jgi:hypothetical protein
MKALLWLNHVLIILFAVSSGVFKVLGGQADIEVFSHLGMGATAVAVFGAVQAVGGVGLLFGASARPAAMGVMACNALATVGLFAAGVIPFGVVSVLFIAMAAVELRLSRAGLLARPRPSAPAAA